MFVVVAGSAALLFTDDFIKFAKIERTRTLPHPKRSRITSLQRRAVCLFWD